MTDSGIDGIGFLDRMNPTWAVQSLFVETSFESHSHEDMISMVKASDPDTTRRLGQKLADAARDMDAIAQALSNRAPRVDWDGQGARAFTDWNQSMVNSTRRLAEFSRSSGEAMKNAADTLQEVKRDMPPYPDSARLTLNGYLMQNPGGMAKLEQGEPSPYLKGNDPKNAAGPTATEAYDAKQQLENGHGEAVRQMRKLSTAYSLADTTMKRAQRPTFPPMPGQLMPEKTAHLDDNTHLTLPSSGGSVVPSPAQQGGNSSVGELSGERSPGAVAKSDNVATALNSSVALPEAPRPPAPQQSVTGPGGPAAPSGPVVGPGVPSGPRQTTQRSVGKGGQPHPGQGGIRPPTASSGGPVSRLGPRTGGRLPADHGNGIYGGRPVPGGSGQPTPGLPRGGVVGDPTQNQHGRAPMAGRPFGGGLGGSGGGQPASGVVGGQPRASTPGGRVGTPSSSGITGGRPFTAGGSGLVRGGSESSGQGVMGRPTTNAPPAEDRRSNGRRPDYLVEDEETWQTRDGARHVPPVIE